METKKLTKYLGRVEMEREIKGKLKALPELLIRNCWITLAAPKRCRKVQAYLQIRISGWSPPDQKAYSSSESASWCDSPGKRKPFNRQKSCSTASDTARYLLKSPLETLMLSLSMRWAWSDPVTQKRDSIAWATLRPWSPSSCFPVITPLKAWIISTTFFFIFAFKEMSKLLH